MTKSEILVKDLNIRVNRIKDDDYICLTDLAKAKNPNDPRFIVYSWLRNKETLNYIGIWEDLYNSNFNRVEFDTVTKDAGLHSFMISPNVLIEKANVSCLTVSAGRYNGGIFAHKDVAIEFAGWISAEFKLYLNKEFQRLKFEEQKDLEWSAKRELAKINYAIHTDAIKENLIAPTLTKNQINFVYADEADLLNVALFGKTASEWRKENPNSKGNIRDYASIEQLLVMANMESFNAILIEQKVPQSERLVQLNNMAKSQLIVLSRSNRKLLK